MYRDWPRHLPAGIDVQPVSLPGREHRITEPPHIDPAAIAEAIDGRADRPYALYGHSMGARIAYEVVRRLRAAGRPLPVRCYVGAAGPPDVADEITRSVRLPDERFTERIVSLGGMAPEILAEPELLDLLLPILRADLGWLDAYRYEPGEPLPMPLVAFAGRDDPDAGPAVMAGWRRHAAAGFDLHVLDGGHFFQAESLPVLSRLLADDLTAALRAQG